MGFIGKAVRKYRQKQNKKKAQRAEERMRKEIQASPERSKGIKEWITEAKKEPTISKGMAKKKMLEQTPTGMANKTGSDAVIPPGHAQRKSKL